MQSCRARGLHCLEEKDLYILHTTGVKSKESLGSVAKEGFCNKPWSLRESRPGNNVFKARSQTCELFCSLGAIDLRKVRWFGLSSGYGGKDNMFLECRSWRSQLGSRSPPDSLSSFTCLHARASRVDFNQGRSALLNHRHTNDSDCQVRLSSRREDWLAQENACFFPQC